jgi:hypothetical protein
MALHNITWPYTISHGPTQHHMALHNITRPYTTTHGPTQHHMALHNITWPYTISHGPTQYHMALHNITWPYTTSHGPTQHHMALHNITRILCTCWQKQIQPLKRCLEKDDYEKYPAYKSWWLPSSGMGCDVQFGTNISQQSVHQSPGVPCISAH